MAATAQRDLDIPSRSGAARGTLRLFTFFTTVQMGRKHKPSRRAEPPATDAPRPRQTGASASPVTPRTPDRRVVAVAVFSTILLFALLLSSIWIGERLYESLPLGPIPQSRLVSALISLLFMFGGFTVVRAVASAIGRRRH